MGLINVGIAATEESTAADAAGQTPGKTVAIAERSATAQAFPHAQSGTGRLSFRLRRLQRNAKHPACLCSLRSVKEKAVSRLGAFSGKIFGHCANSPHCSEMAPFSTENFTYESPRLDPVIPHRPKGAVIDSAAFDEVRRSFR